MPVNFVDISADVTNLKWKVILETLADCIAAQIKPVVSGARIYPYWVYEIDVNTMLGKVVAPMLADTGTSQDKVHCWTLGVSSASVLKNESAVKT